MVVIRDGANSRGTSRFLAHPERTVPAEINKAAVRVRRDIASLSHVKGL
jgi:hypothetical protein